MEKTIAMAARKIKSDLVRFYHQFHEDHPRRSITKVGKFSRNILGDSGQRLKTKGAETYGVLLYLLSKLLALGDALPDGARMLRAGGALEKLVALWRDAGPVLTEAEQAMSLLLWMTHLDETEHDMRTQLP